jgi:MoxR-like ATPase
LKKEVAAALELAAKDLAVKVLEIRTPTETKKIEGLVHEKFESVLRLASQRKNILLVGPSGCGKTYLAAQVAEALGLSFNFLSCSIGMSESQLLGWLLPTGEGGQFVYQESAFVHTYENGGVFLLDEIDAADANLLTILNASLSNGHLAVPQRHSNPIAKKSENCLVMAAGNTFGHGPDRVYAGRNQLDGATLERFKVGTVYCDYDARIETQTVNPKLLEWGHRVRGKITDNKLRRIMSTRFLQEATQMMAAYPTEWTLPYVKEVYFQDWKEDEKNKVGA